VQIQFLQKELNSLKDKAPTNHDFKDLIMKYKEKLTTPNGKKILKVLEGDLKALQELDVKNQT